MAERKSLLDGTVVIKTGLSREDGYGMPKAHPVLAGNLAFLMKGELPNPLESIIESTSGVMGELDELNEVILLGGQLAAERVSKLGRLLGEELVDIYMLIESVDGIKDAAAKSFMDSVIDRKKALRERE